MHLQIDNILYIVMTGTLSIKNVLTTLVNLSSSTPVAPVNGDIWYEGNIFKCRINNATVNLIQTTNATINTKGDIQSHNGSAISKLSVSADNLVLTVDSTAPCGIAWKDTRGDFNNISDIVKVFPSIGNITYKFVTLFLEDGNIKILKNKDIAPSTIQTGAAIQFDCFCYNAAATTYKFITKANGTFYRSADGITYATYTIASIPHTFSELSLVTASPKSFNSLIYTTHTTPRYIAAISPTSTANARIIYSTDTSNWLSTNTTDSNITSIFSIATNAVSTIIIAKGLGNSTVGGYKSTDGGVSYTTLQIAGGGLGNIICINELFIACISTDIVTSSNGTTWTSRKTGNITCVDYSPERTMYLAGDISGTNIWHYTPTGNGINGVTGTWITGSGCPLASIHYVKWCNPLWIIADNSTPTNYAYSADGISWSAAMTSTSGKIFLVTGFYGWSI
jgi:hypothetical protein